MVTMWVMGGTCVCTNHRPQRENKMEGPWSTSRIVSFAVLTVLVFQQEIVLSHYDPRPYICFRLPGHPVLQQLLEDCLDPIPPVLAVPSLKPEPLWDYSFVSFFPGLLSILGLRV